MRDLPPMVVYCGAAVCKAGPTLNHQWVHLSCSAAWAIINWRRPARQLDKTDARLSDSLNVTSHTLPSRPMRKLFFWQNWWALSRRINFLCRTICDLKTGGCFLRRRYLGPATSGVSREPNANLARFIFSGIHGWKSDSGDTTCCSHVSLMLAGSSSETIAQL